MKQFRFLLVDLTVDNERIHSLREAYESFRNNCVANLRELANLAAVTPCMNNGTFGFSLIAINSQKTETLLKPRKFSMCSMHKAIDKLEKFPLYEVPASDTEPPTDKKTDQGWEALKQTHNLVTQLKRNKSKAVQNEFRVNIIYLSPRVLPRIVDGGSLGDIVRPLIEETVMCSMEFIFVEMELPMDAPQNTTDGVNLPLELFGVFIQEFYQCSLLRVPNDNVALQRHFRRWIAPPPFTAVLSFQRSGARKPSETISCDLTQEILDHIAIKPTNICSCCKKKTDKVDYCGKRKCPLSQSEICSVYSVGAVALKFLSSNEDSPEHGADVILTVECRIPLASVSSSLLYGQPYVLSNCTNEKFEWEELLSNNERFQATCQILSTRESGLLVSMTQDIGEHTISFSPLTHYFLLVPEDTTNTRSLLMRRIAVSEQILPSTQEEKRVIPETTLAQTSALLDQIPEEQYNPLDYDMRFHQRVNGFVRSNRSTKSLPVTSLPKLAPTTTTPKRGGSGPPNPKPVLFSSIVSTPMETSPKSAPPSSATAVRKLRARNAPPPPSSRTPSPFDFMEE